MSILPILGLSAIMSKMGTTLPEPLEVTCEDSGVTGERNSQPGAEAGDKKGEIHSRVSQKGSHLPPQCSCPRFAPRGLLAISARKWQAEIRGPSWPEAWPGLD